MISEPASANAIAISAPIPRVPPVITVVRPARENKSIAEADILIRRTSWMRKNETLNLFQVFFSDRARKIMSPVCPRLAMPDINGLERSRGCEYVVKLG